jgi:hypothetical protein
MVNTIHIESIGLAAFMIMSESESLKYKGYVKETRSFEFDSDENEDYWANKYDLSREKQHDQIVMRLRNLKK